MPDQPQKSLSALARELEISLFALAHAKTLLLDPTGEFYVPYGMTTDAGVIAAASPSAELVVKGWWAKVSNPEMANATYRPTINCPDIAIRACAPMTIEEALGEVPGNLKATLHFDGITRCYLHPEDGHTIGAQAPWSWTGFGDADTAAEAIGLAIRVARTSGAHKRGIELESARPVVLDQPGSPIADAMTTVPAGFKARLDFDDRPRCYLYADNDFTIGSQLDRWVAYGDADTMAGAVTQAVARLQIRLTSDDAGADADTAPAP